MVLPLPHRTWVVLRHVMRLEKAHEIPIAENIRPDYNRITKDGTYLLELVRLGFLKLVKGYENLNHNEYEITPEGRWAAEYGEYECDIHHVAVPLKSQVQLQK